MLVVLASCVFQCVYFAHLLLVFLSDCLNPSLDVRVFKAIKVQDELK